MNNYNFHEGLYVYYKNTLYKVIHVRAYDKCLIIINLENSIKEGIQYNIVYAEEVEVPNQDIAKQLWKGLDE